MLPRRCQAREGRHAGGRPPLYLERHRAGVRRASFRIFEREENTVAPNPRLSGLRRQRELGQFIIDRAAELRLEPVADQQPWGRAPVMLYDPKRMIAAQD